MAASFDSPVINALRAAASSGEVFDAVARLDAGSRTVAGEAVTELLWELSSCERPRGLRVRNLEIQGDLSLQHLVWQGPLGFDDCPIRGDVRLSYASIRGEFTLRGSEVGMLALNYAQIESRVTCPDLIAHRGVFALGAKINGAFTLARANLTAPKEDKRKNRAALDLYRAEIGDLYANKVTLHGGMYGRGVTFTRHVRLAGAEVWNRHSSGMLQGRDAGDGVDLKDATLGGAIWLWGEDAGPLVMHEGSIELGGVKCRSLRVTASQLVSGTGLEGLTYANLEEIAGTEFLVALDAQNPSPREAYAQLARFAESRGDTNLKRDAMIHQQRRKSEGSPWWTLSRQRHALFGLLAGYGYAPGRALGWLLACVAVASTLIKWQGPYLRSLRGGAPVSGWPDAIAYTLNQMTPFSPAGFAAQWSYSPHGSAAWTCYFLFVALKLAAWALAALSLTAVTGLVRGR